MIMLADTPVSSMTDLELSMMLEDIQAEVYERKLKSCKDAMTELYQTVEKVAKEFNLAFVDYKGQEIYLRDICEVVSDEFNTGYVFSDPSLYEKEEKEEITNNEDKSSVIDAKEDEVKRDNEGRVICIHRDDEVCCSNCEYRKYCWPNSWDQL